MNIKRIMTTGLGIITLPLIFGCANTDKQFAGSKSEIYAAANPSDERLYRVAVISALPDGTSANAAWYHISKQPLFGPTGTVVGILDLAYEITSRVRAQQELLRRREAIEKLLGEQAQTLRRAQEELGRWSSHT